MRKLLIIALMFISLNASAFWGGFEALLNNDASVTPPTSALVLEYLMGTNGSPSTITLDTSGNNLTGTVVNASYSIPTNGSSGFYDFDGVSDYIATATGIVEIGGSALASGYTESIWLKRVNSDATEMVLSKTVTSQTGRESVGYFSNSGAGKILYLLYEGGIGQDNGSDRTGRNAPDANVTPNEWHQLTFDYHGGASSTNIEIFVDLIKVDDTSTYMGSFTNISNLGGTQYIGSQHTTVNEFTGGLAEYRKWGRVLTSAEKSTNYITEANQLGIISDYLASNTNTYWQDTALYVGFNNIIQDGSVSNHVLTTTSAPDLVGTAEEGWGVFDNNSNYVRTTIPDSLSTNWTVCCWVKPYSIGQGASGRVFDNRATGGVLAFFGQVGDLTANMNYAGGESTGGAPSIKTNEWVFMSYMVDGSVAGNECRIYTNGVLYVSETPYNITAGDTTLDIGNEGAQTRTFDGIIDEFQLYNRILTTNELIGIHDSSKGAHINP